MNENIKKSYFIYFFYLVLYLVSPIILLYILGFFWGLMGYVIILLFLPLKMLIALIISIYITFFRKGFYHNNILPLSNFIFITLILIDLIWYLSVFGLKKINIVQSSWFLLSFSTVFAYLPFYITFIFEKFIKFKFIK